MRKKKLFFFTVQKPQSVFILSRDIHITLAIPLLCHNHKYNSNNNNITKKLMTTILVLCSKEVQKLASVFFSSLLIMNSHACVISTRIDNKLFRGILCYGPFDFWASIYFLLNTQLFFKFFFIWIHLFIPSAFLRRSIIECSIF